MMVVVASSAVSLWISPRYWASSAATVGSTTGGPTMPPEKLVGYCEVREAACGPQSVLCPLRVFLPFLLFFLLGCRAGAGVAAPENGEAVDWAIMNACWALRRGNSVAIVCCAIAGVGRVERRQRLCDHGKSPFGLEKSLKVLVRVFSAASCCKLFGRQHEFVHVAFQVS